MPFEIHMVVAGDKTEALTRISVLAAGRDHVLLSTGMRSQVSFENLDKPASRHNAGSQLQPVYCAVLRVNI